MKNLAIHAVIVLLALACFADAFRLQSKVKSTLATKDEEWDYEACSDCTAQCGSFIYPEPTEEAHSRCVNAALYDNCCDDNCSEVCPQYACFYGIYSHCSSFGWYPM